MCVTYGETFLSDTKSYDSLYYEIIRATQDFIKLSEYGNLKTKTKKTFFVIVLTLFIYFTNSQSINYIKIKR